MNIYIPFVNNKPCLEEAINSLGKYRNQIIVIDNSENQNLELDNVKIVKPVIPLFVSQVWNYISKICENEVFIIMHSDAIASELAYEQLVKKIEEFGTENWGIIFTNYDSFCAINKKSFNSVGGAEPEFLRYFGDNDLYRKFDLAGYKRGNLDTDVKHKNSMTINSDSLRLLINEITFPMQKEFYRRKWGGIPGEETFSKPFNK